MIKVRAILADLLSRRRKSAPVSAEEGANRSDPRIKIFLWPFVLTLLCGVVNFGSPLEDVIQSGRDFLRAHDADQEIVVVGIDNRTVAAVGDLNLKRSLDAKVLDVLFANGAKRVFYDRVMGNAGVPKEDEVLIAALTRHEGKVFLGVMNPRRSKTNSPIEKLPHPEFEKHSKLISLNGLKRPFGLTARLPFSVDLKSKNIPSMSSALAKHFSESTENYRPDWSITAQSIPTVSFLDVSQNRVPRNQIDGKDIVIGPTADTFDDLQHILSQSWMPGVYFHVIGAETLKHGMPVNWGWIPGFVLAIALAITQMLLRKPRAILVNIFAAVFVFAIVPLYLDALHINAEVVPGALLFVIVTYRAMTLRRVQKSSQTNVETGLPNLSALRDVGRIQAGTLIALRLGNLAEIAASFSATIEQKIVDEILRRASVDGDLNQVYQTENALLWLTPLPMGDELAHHLEGLRALMTLPVIIDGRDIDVAISFGIDADVNRPIASRIGSAMLCAEEAGKKRQIWQLYDPERQHEAAWQLSLLSRLDQAIDAGEIWVAYQPKLNLKKNKITCAEALVRWNHPERGLIGPDEFIALAEKHGRIDKLTRFVLGQAIRSTAELNRKGVDLSIAVNLSVQLLETPTLLTFIDDVLAANKFPPQNLTLEITETGRLNKTGGSLAMMKALAGRGIHLSIDDYGTGNATLDYLKILPADEVKIDREFIRTLERDSGDLIVVGSTIEMAQSLGHSIVAEGVETEAVLDVLRRLGCDYAQGYLISKPVTFEQLTQQLSVVNYRAAVNQ
jgi:diguanylate cyclase